jgi:putative transposase
MDSLPCKTRRAWDEPGHAHFLTYSCFRRLPLLTRNRTRCWVEEALEATRRELDVALWAYVIMPEHVHVLLCPRQASYEMRRILVALKRPVSDAARQHLEHTGNDKWLDRLSVEYPSRRVFRFWQPGGGFDHNIFREKTVPTVIDYIHANPVRRGLVERPTDWEWSSARFWDGRTDVPIRMDDPLT